MRGFPLNLSLLDFATKVFPILRPHDSPTICRGPIRDRAARIGTHTAILTRPRSCSLALTVTPVLCLAVAYRTVRQFVLLLLLLQLRGPRIW